MVQTHARRIIALAKQDEAETVDLERLVKQIEMLDKRLDSVDSIVSAVAERVMQQPITLNITCPKCGQKVEIAILGVSKPGR